MEQQAVIERERKKLLMEFKKLANVNLKAPGEEFKAKSYNLKTERKFTTSKKNLKSNNYDKELDKLLT